MMIEDVGYPKNTEHMAPVIFVLTKSKMKAAGIVKALGLQASGWHWEDR